LYFAVYQFHFGVLIKFWPELLRAAGTTVLISVTAFAISMPISLGAVFLRCGKHRLVRILVAVYVEIFRNTPLLVIVYVLYFGLPSINVVMGAYTCGILALTLCGTAYLIEIFRGSLSAIPIGQYHAAATLGMTRFRTNATIIIPQLMRISYPAVGNQVNGMILGSSLVSVIGINDITQVSYLIGSETFRYIEAFMAAAVLYIVVTHTVSYLWRLVGRRLRRGMGVL
jgi:His/Glu/Gln/Arg/opine family amino acid ABC transporter permease subunit